MGWWSTRIMGGDSPLDIQSELFEAFGKEQFPDDSDDEVKLTAEDFDSHTNAFGVAEDIAERWGCDQEICLQVFAYLLMEAGGKMSDEVREKTTQACIDDSWAKEDEEREDHITKLRNHIETYEDKPIANLEQDSGLLSKIAEEMNPGLNIDLATMKYDMEQELAELKTDQRLSYSTADVFTNAPLALIQLGLETKVNLLEKYLKLPLSVFPLPKAEVEG